MLTLPFTVTAGLLSMQVFPVQEMDRWTDGQTVSMEGWGGMSNC